MNRVTLQAFSAGIIFATSIITGFYYGNHLNEEVTFSQADAKKMLEDQGYSVTNNTVETKSKIVSKEQMKKATEKSENNEVQEQAKEISYTLSVTYMMTVEEIAETLKQEKIIDDATTFKNYMREQNLTRKVQVNEYIVTSDMNYEELGKLLTTRSQ
jgi:hypothetical protein